MSTNPLRKLPPDVARELLRHVKPSAKAEATAAAKAAKAGGRADGKRTVWPWLAACTAFTGAAASLPYWVTQSVSNLTDRDDPLTAAQVRRGPFLNSGSRDAGKDPNWDWKQGKYVYPEGFAEHLKKQSPNDTDFGPDIGTYVAQEKQQRGS